jgi:hypothetical protein
MKRRHILLFVLLLAFGAAACNGSGGTTLPGGSTITTNGSDTTNSPDTTGPDTTIPDTTTSPDTTTAGGGGDDTTPWWLLIVIGAAFLILIVALVSRGSKKSPPQTASRLTWKDHGRQGYADARWLYDAMSDDVAIWRGNAQFDGVTAVGATASTGKAELWNEIGPRLDGARSSLYALEAAAPDPQTAQSAQVTVNSMMTVRSALDSRADARAAYRAAEVNAADNPQTLMDARDREVRASTNLNQARAEFARALTNLSTVI